MPAAKHNIVIEQGATFPLYITWKDPQGVPIDLTGYRIRMQIRQSPSAAGTLVSFDSGALVTGQTIGALDGSGVIDIRLAPSITSLLTFTSAEWDLTAESAGGVVSRLLEGKASVSLAVTR